MENENAVQAVVLMDTFSNNFDPITNYSPMGLFAVAGVPLIIYLLESLALGGVNKAILFCCNDGVEIKEYIRTAKEQSAPWTLSLDAQVLMSETCQTMGDVMREIDAAGLIKGYFVLTSINNIANIPYASMLEQHKALSKKDKGATMTLVYKQVSWEHPLISGDEAIFLAADKNTRKVLTYKTYKPKSKDDTIALTLESVINHSEVTQHHNLLDANIALCSLSVLRLFSDNFDFQTRDDFINGILANEGILASSLYFTLVKDDMYAATVTNRRTYETISRDIINQSALPLSIKSGSLYQDNYELVGNNTFCHKTTKLSRSAVLVNSQIGPNSIIGSNTVITNSIIGANSIIGNNVVMVGSRIGNNVIVRDSAVVINRNIGNNAIVSRRWNVEIGTIITSNVNLSPETEYKGTLVKSRLELNEKNLKKSIFKIRTERENESTGKEEDETIGFQKTDDDNYEYIGNNAFCHKTAKLSRSAVIVNSQIGPNSVIGSNTVITNSIIGANSIIGNNVVMVGSRIGNNVIVRDSAVVINRNIGNNAIVSRRWDVEIGTIITSNVNLSPETEYKGTLVKSRLELNEKILRKSTSKIGTERENESTGKEKDETIGFQKTVDDNYEYIGNNAFCHKTAKLSRSCLLKRSEIGANTLIGANTIITNSVIGADCVIGNNVVITGSHIARNTVIKDNCKIINSIVNANGVLQTYCSLEDVVILADTVINDYTIIKKSQIGANCVVGRYVTVTGSNIGNNVVITDNARVINRDVSNNSVVSRGGDLDTILTSYIKLATGTNYKRVGVESGPRSNEKKLGESIFEIGTQRETKTSSQ